ncbi:MAG: hypothetical protein CVV44_09020 [Spirochaetae bacterium HGW-Spirochaetae-1]|nr:MAG: hypothetical protein CVV44_09020 [Spirochaetae bacterium HGW-Spirochaetae-1]
MKRWVELIMRYPRLTIASIVLLTAIAIVGMLQVKFDTSTDAMMPKNNEVYRYNQQAKKIFSDVNTYVLTAIQAGEGSELFSKENFQHLKNLVLELQEYQKFNEIEENRRLQSLLDAGKAEIRIKGKPITEKKADTGDIDKLEEQLDNEIFGDDHTEKPEAESAEKDIWDISQPITKNKFYANAIRERNEYDYSGYVPVSLRDIKKALGTAAVSQLDTIIEKHSFGHMTDDTILTKREYRLIVESWESLYLYKSMRIIKMMLNPLTGGDIHGEKDRITLRRFLPVEANGEIKIPESAEEFNRLKKTLILNPAYESVLYSLDPRGDIQSLALGIVLRPIKTHTEIFSYLYAAIKKNETKTLKLTPVGIPVYEKFIFDYMNKDLRTLIPLVLFVIVMTFFLNFRSPRGVILPALSVTVSTIWVVGIMGFFKIPITVMVNMLPALLVAVGSSYAIHVYTQYLHDRDTIIAADKKLGLVKSMNHISSTVILAALTTAIGFFTLAVSELISLKHLGIFSALGSLLAMIAAVTLIPVVLLLLKNPQGSGKLPAGDDIKRNRLVGKIIIVFDHLSQKRGREVIVVSCILFAVGAVGISKIKLESTPMNNFKKDSYLYKAEFMMGKYFNGSLTMNLVFDSGKKDGVNDPAFLRNMEKVRKWLTSPENREKYQMLHTTAYGDFIKRINKAMHNEDPDYYTIPDSRQTITDYLRLYSDTDENSDGRVDVMESFVDTQFRYANILVRVGSIDGRLYSSRLVDISRKAISQYIGNDPDLRNYRWFLLGESMNFMVISRMIIDGQLQSIFITLTLVMLLILFLFRNIKAALVSIIPISMAIVVTYGIMGYTGIPLDISKSLLAAIAIGIGVDNTIHMLKTLKFHLHKGLPLAEAMDFAYREAGIAIVYTSLALIFGFAVLLLSEFLPIFYLAILMVLTMVISTVSALVLLPGIIFYFNLNVDQELDWKIFKIINFKNIFEIDK